MRWHHANTTLKSVFQAKGAFVVWPSLCPPIQFGYKRPKIDNFMVRRALPNGIYKFETELLLGLNCF